MSDVSTVTLIALGSICAGILVARLPVPWLHESLGDKWKWRGGAHVTRLGLIGMLLVFGAIVFGLATSYEPLVNWIVVGLLVTLTHDIAAEYLKEAIPLRVRLEAFKAWLPLLIWIMCGGALSACLVLLIEAWTGRLDDPARILLGSGIFTVVMLGSPWKIIREPSNSEAQQRAPADGPRAARSDRG